MSLINRLLQGMLGTLWNQILTDKDALNECFGEIVDCVIYSKVFTLTKEETLENRRRILKSSSSEGKGSDESKNSEESSEKDNKESENEDERKSNDEMLDLVKSMSEASIKDEETDEDKKERKLKKKKVTESYDKGETVDSPYSTSEES